MLILVLPDFTDRQLQRLRDAGPSATVESVRRKDPRFAELLPHADAIFGSLSKEEIDRAKNLRWLQLTSVGAGRHAERLPPHVTLTSARGAFGYVVAEHAFALLLAVARGLPRFARQTTWNREAARPRALRGATLGLLGTGDIGRHIATRAQAFGMRTLGINRTGGDPGAGLHELHPIADLDRVLPRCGYLVNSLPETPQTRQLLDARRLALLPPGAIVVNVGRGTTTDQAALIDALREGRLGGAGLDVVDPEPLPPDSPLWTFPNVLITPHVAGDPGDPDALIDLVADNLTRFLAGKPLLNAIDRGRGY